MTKNTVDLEGLDFVKFAMNTIRNTKEFVRESNRIENIHRDPTRKEIDAHNMFVLLPRITIEDVIDFVRVMQPDAVLRDNISVPRVRVGNHIAPPSGSEIREQLGWMLMGIHNKTPYELHCEYLNLHPFTDGNGRSARVIWLWHMNGHAPLGFLHQFYYQSLDGQNPGRS